MNQAEQQIHDLAVKALLFEPEILNDFEPEILNDYAEGERDIKRHDVLEQALIDILNVLPATVESNQAKEHIYYCI